MSPRQCDRSSHLPWTCRVAWSQSPELKITAKFAHSSRRQIALRSAVSRLTSPFPRESSNSLIRVHPVRSFPYFAVPTYLCCLLLKPCPQFALIRVLGGLTPKPAAVL